MTMQLRNQFRGCSYLHTDINKRYGCHSASEYNDVIEGIVERLTSGFKADIKVNLILDLCLIASHVCFVVTG